MVGGRGGSAKSDFITKGALIKHLMMGGGSKNQNHLTSYVDVPFCQTVLGDARGRGKLNKAIRAEIEK